MRASERARRVWSLNVRASVEREINNDRACARRILSCCSASAAAPAGLAGAVVFAGVGRVSGVVCALTPNQQKSKNRATGAIRGRDNIQTPVGRNAGWLIGRLHAVSDN